MMARLPGAIGLAPSEGSGESRRAAGGESQPWHRIAPLLPCLPLIPVKQQTRPVWEKIQKGKATTKTLSSLPFSPSPPPLPPPGCIAKKESYGFGYCTWGRGKSSDTAGRPTSPQAELGSVGSVGVFRPL